MRSRALHLIAVAAILIVLTTPPGRVRAEGLRFGVEYGYSEADTESRSAAGETTDIQTSNFSQRYRLDFDRRLFPAVTVRGGGLFERNESEAEVAGIESDARFTRTSPYLDVLLGSPLYSGALGFRRLDDHTEESGGFDATLLRDTYTASFNWLPVDLPTLSLRYTLDETYDADRQGRDDTSSRFQFGSVYEPFAALRLTYQGTYSQTEDHISSVVGKEWNHSARADYADRFWRDRVALNGSYSLGMRETTVSTGGIGEVATFPQVVVPPRLFALDDSPQDGELGTFPTAGVNVGFQLDRTLRNIGIQFLDPETRINALRIPISSNQQLTAAIAGSFVWRVFVSDDNVEGSIWSEVSGVSATFLFNQFELRFPEQRTRFIKVVVAPLSVAVPRAQEFPEILLLDLSPVLFVPAAEAEGSTSATSHQLSLNVRTKLLEARELYHEFSLFYTAADPGSFSRTFISNGVFLLHRFNPKLTGTLQAAREDSDETKGQRVGYRWGFSLVGTPIPALRHTLTYSGQVEDGPDGSARRNSLFLNNRAALYRGVDVFLNAGGSFGKEETGEDTENYLVNLGTQVLPHRSLALDLNVSADRSERSGGGSTTTSTNRRGRLGVSYNPVPALSLYLSYEKVLQEDRDTTLRNYSVSWSPFRDGDLQFGISYNESLRLEENAIDRTLVPSLTWEIRPATFLTLSYAWVESESAVGESESRVFSSALRATF